MTVDAEWFAEIGAAMGETLAHRPDLTPADLGARLARIVGEELGVDPERIEAAEAVARADFASIRRGTLIGIAADRLSRTAREQDGPR